ncbi:hypothetical protein D0Y65_005984 [Glycine soja]|uniref:Uncharacterized protein n=1 Tax=Glycine soja TaxID=3848 RepID=A0A445L747_GLYSO|nr:hypothetical protein D0Y65_005984 [Glycine soja]
MLEVVSSPWRFTVGNWLCNSDLFSPTGIERVLTEKDLLADSYSDLEASILDEKEFLLLKVISTFPELSCLIFSIIGAGRGSDGVAFSMTHFSGIHVLIDIFESDFLIEEIVFRGDLLGLDSESGTAISVRSTCKIVLTWRCFAIGNGETRDVEVGLASSTGKTGEARAARSGVAE